MSVIFIAGAKSFEVMSFLWSGTSPQVMSVSCDNCFENSSSVDVCISIHARIDSIAVIAGVESSKASSFRSIEQIMSVAGGTCSADSAGVCPVFAFCATEIVCTGLESAGNRCNCTYAEGILNCILDDVVLIISVSINVDAMVNIKKAAIYIY